MITYFWCLSI